MNNQTILLVDDTKSNLDLLIDLLDDYDNIPVLDGQSAISIAGEEHIDLILLDIMMPEMNGFETCIKLKEDPKTSKIPIIFLTAKNSQDDIKKAFDLGAVDYILKPFNPHELRSRVKTHLELRSYQKDLEKRVRQEIEKNRFKERLMFQQSKQAEMGELLMHIAHQWKQPVSELGSINTYNIAKLKQSSNIDKEELLLNFEKNSDILKFISTTVETFQNFYKTSSTNNFFTIANAVDNAVNIISATLDYNNITLNIQRKSDPEVYGNQNEYSQVILALLNNAKDILIYRQIDNPTIEISIDKNLNGSIVKVSDNAGGVKENIIENIFDPFISGKNGLGIGLYMSKMILEKNRGDITIKNIDNKAEFTIVL